MAKYKIAWLPGDGIGVDVLEAAKLILNKIALDAKYKLAQAIAAKI